MRQWLRIAFPRNYLDRRKRAGFLFVLPALLFFGSVFILPLAQSILYSFYKIAPGGASEFVGLRLYEKVLTDSTFWTAVLNTVPIGFQGDGGNANAAARMESVRRHRTRATRGVKRASFN